MAYNLCLPKWIPTFEPSKEQEIASFVQRIGTRIGDASRSSLIGGAGTLCALEIQRGRLESFPASAMGYYRVGAGSPTTLRRSSGRAREGGCERAEKAKNEVSHSNPPRLLAQTREMAEPCAEWMHRRIREDWGFPDLQETLIAQRFASHYRGKQYSFGYPACPKLTLRIKQDSGNCCARKKSACSSPRI